MAISTIATRHKAIEIDTSGESRDGEAAGGIGRSGFGRGSGVGRQPGKTGNPIRRRSAGTVFFQVLTVTSESSLTLGNCREMSEWGRDRLGADENGADGPLGNDSSRPTACGVTDGSR